MHEIRFRPGLHPALLLLLYYTTTFDTRAFKHKNVVFSLEAIALNICCFVLVVRHIIAKLLTDVTDKHQTQKLPKTKFRFRANTVHLAV